VKRPAFQFYPADWRNNAKLRRCSEAARGVWMDILCVLHDSDEYGVCRWPLADLARAAGSPLKLVRELVSKDVLKGADANAEPYVYTPRHAGKDGEPVTLVEVRGGPCWYCSRFVRDEWVRQRRGSGTQFTTDSQPPKPAPNSQPKGGIGERQGDGPTSTSTSTTSPSLRSGERSPTGSRLPADWVCPEEWLAYCRSERPELDASVVACNFADYWHGKAGAGARKADWLATWRSWVRKEDAPKPQGRLPPESFRERDLRLASERVAAFTGRRPAENRETIEIEATDVTPIRLGR